MRRVAKSRACRFPEEIEGSGVTEGYTGTKWEPVGTLAEGSVVSLMQRNEVGAQRDRFC